MPELPENPEVAYSADELGEYRAISSSAFLAMLLGLLSPVALFSPVLIMVPLIALALALVALSRTGKPGSVLAGARLARIGLALAIVCGVASCTKIAVIYLLASNQVEEQALD